MTGFLIDRCSRCGTDAVWPRHACVECGATSFGRADIDGGAVIRSVTLVHRPPTTGVETAPPYAIVLIELDAGGRLMVRLPRPMAIGDRVIATRAHPCDIPDIRQEDPGVG